MTKVNQIYLKILDEHEIFVILQPIMIIQKKKIPAEVETVVEDVT